MFAKIRDLLDLEMSDEMLNKFVDDYMSGGYLSIGHDDLTKHQTCMNVLMIVIDAMRPYKLRKSTELLMDEINKNPHMKQLHNEMTYAIALAFQEGSNACNTNSVQK